MSEVPEGMKALILKMIERLRTTTHLLTRIELELKNTKENISSILSCKSEQE
jgi:hypothetical protein